MPHPATELYGREAEIAVLSDALLKSTTMAVTGPAGVGKTRLAREMGRRWSGDVVMCDVSVASESACLRSVGRGLGISLPASMLEATSQIAHALEGRRNALLVLDGAEGMPDSLGDAVLRWNEAAKVLITSRRKPAYVSDEVSVGPLSVDEALRLLVERARQVRPGFELADAHREPARRLVERVDCLPLAIELLAPRLRLLTPPQLLQRLAEDPKSSGPLFAALERSWALLRPQEQQALSQLSVFPAGFFVPAAEAVISLEEPADVLTILESLVAHNLLHTFHVPELPDEVRIAPFSVVRDLARAKLDDEGAAARRHAEHYLSASERWDSMIESDAEAEATARLVVELRNIERAYASAQSDEMKARAGLVLHLAYQRAGPFEGQRELTQNVAACAERVGDAALQARAELAVGRVHRWEDRLAESDNALSKALTHAIRATDVATEAGVHRNLVANAFRLGDLERAAKHIDAAVKAGERSPLRTDRVNALHALGYLHGQRGELEEAEARLEEAVRLADDIGAPGLIALVRESLAEMVLRQARFAEATRHASLVIEGYRELGYLRQLVHALVLRARAQTFLDKSAAADDVSEALKLAKRFGLSATLQLAQRFAIQLAFLRQDFQGVVEQGLNVGQDARPWVLGARRLLGHAPERIEESTQGELEQALLRFASGGPLSGEASDPETQAWLEGLAQAASAPAVSSTLELGEDLRWFRLEPGDKVNIGRRRAIRGILKRLVERHQSHPGEPLTLDELLEAGWPSERMSFDSGQRRVWVTINRLRNLGLESLLITADDGYMLAPSTRIVRN